MAIKNVGVVGCGLMGSGIAQVCAEAGYQVLVREVDEGFLKKGLGNIERLRGVSPRGASLLAWGREICSICRVMESSR